MLTWHVVVLSFAVLWGVQIAGTALQMRHVRTVLQRISRTWNDGYVGCGAARAAWGAGGIAVVVAAPDLSARQVLVMHGRTVFARLRPVPALEGASLQQLRAGEAGPCAGRSAAAIRAAVDQVDRVRAGVVPPGGEPAAPPPLNLARTA